jgi:two-component system CheB/CheR fusion protein
MKNDKIDPKILRSNYIPTAEFYSQVIYTRLFHFTLDNDFMINSWSSGSTRIFGYESDEIVGKHFDHFHRGIYKMVYRKQKLRLHY